MRTMARRPDGADQALVELKAVDAAYPLVGAVEIAGGSVACSEALRDGAVVDPILLERLGLKVGDAISARRRPRCRSPPRIDVRARHHHRPAHLSARASSSRWRRWTRPGCQPGTLVRWRYAVKLADGAGKRRPSSRRFRERSQGGAPRGRLHHRRPARSLAAGEPHARAAAAVPDAHRAHGAAGRRRRRRQRGRDLHRPPPQGDRHHEEPRRHQPAWCSAIFLAAGAGDGGDRRRASASRSASLVAARARRAVRRRCCRSRPSSRVDAASVADGARLRASASRCCSRCGRSGAPSW